MPDRHVHEIMPHDPVTVDVSAHEVPSAYLTTLSPPGRSPSTTAVGILSIGDLAVERDPDSALADISAASPNR